MNSGLALVLFLVIDQMRADYVTRYAPDLSPAGIQRLVRQGVYFPDAAYDYALTKTAPGHALLSSGLYPSQNGLVGNEWFDRASDQDVQADEPAASHDGRVALRWWRGTSFAQRLRQTHPRARLFSLSHKRRGALLATGPGQDNAFWMEKNKFRAFGDIPPWLDTVNQTLRRNGLLSDKPRMDAAVAEAAVALIDAESIGQNPAGAPDVLTVSLSGMDYVGHRHGPDSEQIRAALREADAAVARVLEQVEARVGRDRMLVILTADHGVTPVPEAQRQKGQDAGRYRFPIGMEMNRGYVQAISVPFVYLNDEKIARDGADRTQVLSDIRQDLLKRDGAAAVYTSQDIQKDPSLVLLSRSLYPGRSGDLYVVLKPGWIFSRWPYGTTHGQPSLDDQAVPLVFWGGGLAANRILGAVSPGRIAPTVLKRLGCSAPDLQKPLDLSL